MKSIILWFLLVAMLDCNLFSQNHYDYSFDGGGEYIFESHNICLTNNDRSLIWKEIKQNQKNIINDKLPFKNCKQSIAYEWPLRKHSSLVFNNYYGISNFVDHDNRVDSILDYNCFSRTYDGHKGTDIFTWPFPWYLYNNNYIEVIASEAGTIINKHDGNIDDHCSWNAGGSWNAVYIQHTDGTIAWYGHLKQNSLTSKTVGQMVVKGEYLGVVASSGNSTGPHLHFEVYDSLNNLIDPFQGNCNVLNSFSCWLTQRTYRDPTVNAILTHEAKPIHGCPGINEDPHVSNNFSIGDTIFLAVYFADRQAGDSAKYRIKTPNNITWDNWNQVSSMTFNASWYYWIKLLPLNGPFGIWEFEVDFFGQTYTHYFNYSAIVSIEDILQKTRILKRVTNVLGRNINPAPNVPLFYIYDNGTVEKRITIE